MQDDVWEDVERLKEEMKEQVNSALKEAHDRLETDGPEKVMVELVMAIDMLPNIIKTQRDTMGSMHKMIMNLSVRVDNLQAQIHVLSEELLMLRGERDD